MLVGTTLRHRYKIIQTLGSGGFGDTYLAEDLDLPNHPICVVKHFHPKGLGTSGLATAKRLFDTEAQALYRLGKKYDRIPELFAHFEEEKEFYLVQEYIEGHDLSHELKPGQQLNEARVTPLLENILEILAFAHQQNMIHRDIKPTNLIRRNKDGALVLLDFGAVKEIGTPLNHSEGETKPTVAVGTPGYMPSEQAAGRPKLSSDVYAVGIIAIQALTGLNPGGRKIAEDPETGELLWRHHAQVRAEFANIIDRMVRYDYRARYPSAVEALEAIRGLKGSVSPTILPHSSVTTPPSPNPITKRKPLLLSLLAVIALPIIGLGYVTFRSLQEDNAPEITSQDSAENYLTYVNSAEGIRLSYPVAWSKEENPNPITNTLVKFFSPNQGGDTFQENVSVMVEDLSSQPMTLNEYTEVAIHEIEQFLVNAQILESSPTVLAKSPGFKVVYTGQRDNVDLKFMQVWTMRNNKVYVMTYEADMNEYAEVLPTAQQIVDSLETR